MDRYVDYGKEHATQMMQVIETEDIRPVYQPIVSLKDGEIYAFEGLSRMNPEKCSLCISDLFKFAEQENKLWQLESICRKKTLRNARYLDSKIKLFINVDPLVIEDPKFRQGFTQKILEKHNISSDRIVFEITEKNSIYDKENFSKIIQHYKNERFKIAIDDFGEGYAGINRVCSLMPEYLKLDIEMIRDIDKDTVKQKIVKNIVKFCKEINTMVIAEGIETKEELIELIRLEVNFGQGFLLQRPKETFEPISHKIRQLIIDESKENHRLKYKPTFFGKIGEISSNRQVCLQSDLSEKIYESMIEDSHIREVCVLDKEKRVVGLILRTELLEKYGGRYGFTLNSKKNALQVSTNDYLQVEYDIPIDKVSELAMARSEEHLYDAVVVTRNKEYFGIATVKDLLSIASDIQVRRASESNPLTGLPGNHAVEDRILTCVDNISPYAIIYIDIDNFKAYNDAYGFNNGDKMIKQLAMIIEECCKKVEFKGHIGGDDFVVIAQYHDVTELCQNIIDNFKAAIKGLYNTIDWENGFILSKNRHGLTEKFQMASLSIAAITNKNIIYHNLEQLSEEIAQLKKKCKQKEGNYYEII